jgi:hypothetical protein
VWYRICVRCRPVLPELRSSTPVLIWFTKERCPGRQPEEIYVAPLIPRYILGLQTAQTLVLSSLVDHDCCSEEAMKARAGEEGEPNSFIEYLIYDDQGYVVEDSSLSE